jgi:Domain of unknown function (DUF4136)
MTARQIAGSLVALWTIGGASVHAADLQPTSPSVYVTFFILDGNTPDRTDLDSAIKAQIEIALADKGLVETSPEDAEAVVVIHTATRTRHSRAALYEGWGGWQWRGADAHAAGSEDYKPGTLVVDMFDAWSKQLVWHGVSSPLSPDSKASHESKAVAAIFRTFPAPPADAAARRHGGATRPADADRVMQILFSPSPAVLVRIDGNPIYQAVPQTGLQRVVNTSTLIVRDEAGMHFLRLGNTWMETYDVTSTWSAAGMVPEGGDRALRLWTADGHHDPLATSDAPLPAVYVSTTPAELVVTDGDPEYQPLSGTSLLQITNTTASVFKEPTDHEVYVHTGSGWFRAWTTAGPWQPVATNQLPADLAAIGLRSFTSGATGRKGHRAQPRSTPSFRGRSRKGTYTTL